MNHFQFSDFQLSQDASRKPALAERPVPPLALRNPIEAAEALFKELGLDRFLERRALTTQKRIEKALAFTSKALDADETSDEAQPGAEIPAARTPMSRRTLSGLFDAPPARNSALAMPAHALPKPVAQQPGIAASVGEHAQEGENEGEDAGYFIEAPWFADEDGAVDQAESTQADMPDAEAARLEEATVHRALNDEEASDADLNDPARVWTSEDIMMLILRDEARAAEIAAWKEAAMMQAWEEQAHAQAA